MREKTSTKKRRFKDPLVTPSVLANIPDCFRKMIEEALIDVKTDSTLISSNSLANRFILERWGIRASQRRKYRNLFSSIRKRSRQIFRRYLSRGQIEITHDGETRTIGIFEFDKVRGNLIYGFRLIKKDEDWLYT